MGSAHWPMARLRLVGAPRLFAVSLVTEQRAAARGQRVALVAGRKRAMAHSSRPKKSGHSAREHRRPPVTAPAASTDAKAELVRFVRLQRRAPFISWRLY